MRKALEFPLALWIDLVLPKRRIMEIYLNIAESAQPAGSALKPVLAYAFGHSASTSRPEAALLAAILANPVRRSARNPGPGVRRFGRDSTWHGCRPRVYSDAGAKPCRAF